MATANAKILLGSIPGAQKSGMIRTWIQEYEQLPADYDKYYQTKPSKDAYEVDAMLSNYTYIPVKPEAQAVQYAAFRQLWNQNYVNVTYGLGSGISFEAIQDFKEVAVTERVVRNLVEACRRTKEFWAASIINNGTNSSQLGGDGAVLYTTQHPTLAGTAATLSSTGFVQSNTLATPADLSEASIEDLLIQIMEAQDTNGNFIKLKAKSIGANPAQFFELERILMSPLQYDTGNNAINAIKSTGQFPDNYFTTPYFTDTTAFYIFTDCPNGLTHYNRMDPTLSQDEAFNEAVRNYKIMYRECWYWTDWRSTYSNGL